MNRRTSLGLLIAGIFGAEGLILSEHYKHQKKQKSKKYTSPNLDKLIKKTPLIWVVDNCDPNYKEGFFRKAQDKLLVYNIEGDCISSYLGINFCQSGTGNNAVCVLDEQGRNAVVCENAGDRMSFFELTYSGLEKKCSVESPISASNVSDNGLVYCLENTGTIFGQRTLAITPETGEIVKKSNYSGCDIVVDDKHDSVWIAGARFNSYTNDIFTKIIHFNRNFTYKSITKSNGRGITSIDYLSDGSVWTAETLSDWKTGRIIRVSQKGDIIDSIDFPTCPSSVAVDRRTDSVWVCAGNSFYKFNSKGDKLFQGKFRTPHCIRVVPTDGSVVVAGKEGVKRYSSGGNLIFSIEGLSDDYTKFVGIAKQR